MKPNPQSGQAVIETLISLPVVLCLIAALGGTSYTAFVQQEIDELFYQALRCQNSVQISSGNSESCEGRLRKKIRTLKLPIQIQKIELNKNNLSNLEYQMLGLFQISISKTFSIGSLK